MDFLKTLKIHDDKEENLATTAPPAPAPAKDSKEHLFDKISSALGGEHKTETPAPLPHVQAPHKEENLFSKLGDAISGRKTPPPPPPPPAKEDLFDKIGSALGHKPTPPPAEPKKTDLFSQITNTITGKKEEPPKPQSLGDKINHALGGGAAGEEKEGKLGKAIDLFQEHVLKEGPQHNESALEQLKDKQIEDTLRKTLGLGEKEKKGRD